MPRLNYGTLLENVVVFEVTRYLLEELPSDSPLGFATSFAMPPLTQCWCKDAEAGNNPYFSYEFLHRLAGAETHLATLRSIWSLCINNRPRLRVRPFYQKAERRMYDSGGPNGALLASMLVLQSDRPVYLWVNDNDERYAEMASQLPESPVSHLDELQSAAKLLGVEPRGSAHRTAGLFPSTIANLETWIRQGEGRRTRFRIGFLDPDNYAEGDTQVSSFDHRGWLRTLASDSANVVSATFSGCQNRGPLNAKRNQRLALFHSDEVALYPQSLVFEYGNFQTGVKIRWPEASIQQATTVLRARISEAWRNWHQSLGALTVHANGHSAN